MANYTRLSLYFPPDHPVSLIPAKERNSRVKYLIERALEHEKTLQEIKESLTRIEKIVSAGTPNKENKPMNNNLSDAEIALIDQMIGLK